MVDIDLDIVTEKPIEIKLFGEKRILRNLTMEEDFKLKALRQELGQLALDSKKDEKQHKKKRSELLKLIIEPISDAEIDKLKRKQFDLLMDDIDFIDIRDQGVVKTKEEYNKLKNEMAQRNIGSGMGFPTI